MCRVTDNLKLVKYIASQYSRGGLFEFDDCFQEGCLGLIYADRTYKEGAVPFAAYAAKNIRWKITIYTRNNNKMVSVPRDTAILAHTILKRKLQDETSELISEQIGKPIKLVEKALLYLTTEVRSLDFKSAKQDSDKEIDNYNSMGYEQDFDNELLIDYILSFAPKNTRHIVKMHIDGLGPVDIAKKLGKTREQVNANIQYARQKIRAAKKEILS